MVIDFVDNHVALQNFAFRVLGSESNSLLVSGYIFWPLGGTSLVSLRSTDWCWYSFAHIQISQCFSELPFAHIRVGKFIFVNEFIAASAFEPVWEHWLLAMAALLKHCHFLLPCVRVTWPNWVNFLIETAGYVATEALNVCNIGAILKAVVFKNYLFTEWSGICSPGLFCTDMPFITLMIYNFTIKFGKKKIIRWNQMNVRIKDLVM